MARRGENIRKRKDGRWEGRYIKGRKPDRTAIWGYVYGHSYTEVKKKMTMRKAEVRAYALSEQNPTFQELSHNWEGSISLGVKASTITHYQYTLEHYILPVLGDYRVQALDEYTLERSLPLWEFLHTEYELVHRSETIGINYQKLHMSC